MINRHKPETISKLRRIQCSKYSDLDDLVIKKATSLGLPLIGGTALELLANKTHTPGVRKRSDNDLDFIAMSGDPNYFEFQDWLKQNINPNKVQVDVMSIGSHDFTPWTTKIDGILTMKPEYLLWSKLTRGTEKDLSDIVWLFNIQSMTDDDIADVCEVLGVTDDELKTLSECLNKYLHTLS